MTLLEIMQGIVDALEPLANHVEGLQLFAGLNPNPTPPSIDVYPGDPFLTVAAFGSPSSQAFFTVRARVSTADFDSGNRLLIRFLDPADVCSVQAALEDADAVVVTADGVSGFREYPEDPTTGGRLLGCEWRVTRFL